MQDTEFEPRRREETIGERIERFFKWLSRRPTESWGFLVAGLLIGGLFF